MSVSCVAGCRCRWGSSARGQDGFTKPCRRVGWNTLGNNTVVDYCTVNSRTVVLIIRIQGVFFVDHSIRVYSESNGIKCFTPILNRTFTFCLVIPNWLFLFFFFLGSQHSLLTTCLQGVNTSWVYRFEPSRVLSYILVSWVVTTVSGLAQCSLCVCTRKRLAYILQYYTCTRKACTAM